MIDWIKDGSAPKPGQHIIIKMPDGRVFGCTVDINGSGIHIDHVDGLDLLAIIGTTIEWYPINDMDAKQNDSQSPYGDNKTE